MTNKQQTSAEIALEIMQRQKTLSKKERKKRLKENDDIQKTPEFIDNYIYSMEHDFIYDGIIDWRGCNIDATWEKYKEEVGYYDRHPEREEESRAFTQEVIQWWEEQCKVTHDEKF